MDNNGNRRFEDYSDPAVTNLNGQPYQSSMENSQYQYGDENYNYGYGNYNYNNGNYNYGNENYNFGYNPYNQDMRRIPLDSKGCPLRNRFGMKLTFAIIEIVFSVIGVITGSYILGLIPLVLSILACIFVCLQNRDFHNGDWEGFMSKSKGATVLLWIAFGFIMVWLILVIVVIVLFFAVGATTFSSLFDELGLKDMEPDYKYEYNYDKDEEPADNSDRDDTSDYDTDKTEINDLEGGYVPMVEGFNSFSLEGADITLPMALNDFLAAGFYMKDEDLEEILEENNSYGYAYYSSENDQYLGTIFVYNVLNQDIQVKDGMVGGITINEGYGDETVDLELIGGLSFGTSPEDAIDVFGSDVTERHMDGDYSYYSWQFTYGYPTSIELDYNSGKLREVWIMNYASLADY